MSYNNRETHATFVCLRPSNSSYSFTGYSDQEGNPHMIVDRYDSNGNPIPRRFTFRRDKRFIKIPLTQKDKEGNSVVEHLRNSPECAGSPNGLYNEDGKQVQDTVWFKEMNDAKDASIVLESKRLRQQATNLALELTGDDLKYMANMCGSFSQNETLQTMKVMEYAETNPQSFIELYKSPDRLIRAMLRTGTAEGKIKKIGAMLQWEGTTLGGNEDDAVSKLTADQALYESVKMAVYGQDQKDVKEAYKVEAPEKTVEDKRADNLARARAAKGKK